MEKLTDRGKQEIRDKIERLKHLKEPYVIWLQVLISVSVVLLIFMAGNVNSQLNKLKVTNNYTIELIENYSLNDSSRLYGTATPNETLNLSALKILLNNLWAVVLLAIFLFIGLGLYVAKYVKFDQEINYLYDLLVGRKKTMVKESAISRFFNKIKEGRMVKKQGLEQLFKKYQYTLLVLSIFLLVTIEFVGRVGYLNNLMALLCALIAYFLLIGIDMPLDREKQTFPLWGFSIVFPLFIVSFCAWTILNIVITLTGEKSRTIWILVWLVLMLYPGIKSWFKK